MPKLNIKEAEVMDLYIARLVADKGLREADRAQHGKISHQVQLEFEEACEKAFIDALPDEKAIELNQKMADDPNFTDAQIEDFFATALPDAEQIMIDTMTKFRAEYLGKDAKSTNQGASAASQPKPAEPVVANTTETSASTQTSPSMVAASKSTNTVPATSATIAAAPNAASTAATNPNMTSVQNITAEPPAGSPVQGTTSERQGASDVEGVATAAATQLGGTNVSSEMPVAQPSVSSPTSNVAGTTAAPVAQAEQNPVINTEEKSE